jgi:hypothetical protein
MLVLMFDLKFRSLQIIMMYLGCENVVIVIAKYEKIYISFTMKANKLWTSNKVGKACCIHS